MTNNTQSIGSNPVPVRGREFVGTVVSDKMANTVTVEWARRRYVPKYQRYEKRRSKVQAHNPNDIRAKEGDLVRIKETRPISKTKNFMVIEVLTQAGEEIVKEDEQSKIEKKAPAKKAVKKEEASEAKE